MLEFSTWALVITIVALLIILAAVLYGMRFAPEERGGGTGRWMQLSFLVDRDDVTLPALKLDPDTELAGVVPADVEVRQRAVLHDVDRCA